MILPEKIDFIATAAFGVESVAERELTKLGFENIKTENSRVCFSGGYDTLCKANLWLRSADRVYIKMGEFRALTFDELFEGVKALPWERWIPENGCFPVSGKSVDSKLSSVPDCQAITKKAIVEKLKLKYKKDWFDEDGPEYKVEIALLKDVATLKIDTSGQALHKRGYRKLTGEAPLKETLACAMIQTSRWKSDRVLFDPFCGSGTIPVEAALIGLNMAPGLKRNFAAEKWPQIPSQAWLNAREEAKDLIINDRELSIQGTDISEEAIELARYHSKLAGVDSHIHFQKRDVRDISSKAKYGFVICNPPFGERIGNNTTADSLYRDIGKVFSRLDTWSFYILTSNTYFEKLFGRNADKRRKLYNGRIQCTYYQFFGPPPKKTNVE